MTRFEVQRVFLDRYQVNQVGGRDMLEYRIPAEALADLNAHIVGAIIEYYLQGSSWFRRGWMPSGSYVLYPPRETRELHQAWEQRIDAHPGFAIIGGDGSREQIVLDLSQDPAPVLLVDITGGGWRDAVRQADHVGQLVDRIEAGAFTFSFDE